MERLVVAESERLTFRAGFQECEQKAQGRVERWEKIRSEIRSIRIGVPSWLLGILKRVCGKGGGLVRKIPHGGELLRKIMSRGGVRGAAARKICRAVAQQQDRIRSFRPITALGGLNHTRGAALAGK